jgi:hypothetical protein
LEEARCLSLGILRNPLLKQTLDPVLNGIHSIVIRWPGGSSVGAGSGMLEEKAEGEEGSKPPLQVCSGGGGGITTTLL